MSGLWLVSYVILWSLVACLALFSLVAARQLGLLHSQLTRLHHSPRTAELGSTCPTIECVDLGGERSVMARPCGKARLIVFVSPDCESCDSISLLLRSIYRHLDLDITIASIVDDAVAAAAFVRRNQLDGISCVLAAAAVSLIGIAETPSGILLDGNAKIIGKLALAGISDIDRLQEALGIAFATKEQITATL